MMLNVFITPILYVPTTVTTTASPITSYTYVYYYDTMTLDALASLTSSMSQATTSSISQAATSSISQATTSSISSATTSSISQAATASILPTIMSSMYCIS